MHYKKTNMFKMLNRNTINVANIISTSKFHNFWGSNGHQISQVLQISIISTVSFYLQFICIFHTLWNSEQINSCSENHSQLETCYLVAKYRQKLLQRSVLEGLTFNIVSSSTDNTFLEVPIISNRRMEH